MVPGVVALMPVSQCIVLNEHGFILTVSIDWARLCLPSNFSKLKFPFQTIMDLINSHLWNGFCSLFLSAVRRATWNWVCQVYPKHLLRLSKIWGVNVCTVIRRTAECPHIGSIMWVIAVSLSSCLRKDTWQLSPPHESRRVQLAAIRNF